MAVNRYKNHLVIFLEDKPYRDILNGIKLSSRMNEALLDVKEPLGGWGKVFDAIKVNESLLKKYSNCNVLLLMDFDDQEKNSQLSFQNRREKFQEIVPQQYKNRVFLLGINHKESEDLRRSFNHLCFEKIGKMLVEDCPNSDLSRWKNIYLECNIPEIERMKKNGIFDWLFKK